MYSYTNAHQHTLNQNGKLLDECEWYLFGVAVYAERQEGRQIFIVNKS